VVVCHVNAQVYKVIQADGTVLYTDTPMEGAESLTLMEDDVNVAAPLATPSATPPPPPVEAKVTPRISVTSPEPEATVRNNEGQLTIVATSNLETPRYQLLLDGSIVATNNSSAIMGVRPYPLRPALAFYQARLLAHYTALSSPFQVQSNLS
jgi:hypothetical protein